MTYFAYIRVSTIRQGQFGVSFQEQKASIQQFAERHGLHIAQWIQETDTAAKVGRRVFRDMVHRLEAGEARGVILHKIDRGARNLRDWADIGDLIDAGVDVRFAHDDLRLDSRGGRLAADIQAIIAADYIRNLREEVKKGFYGRLRQGLYPLAAPVGYQNRGSGQVKTPDPVYGAVVAMIFELYATGEYSIRILGTELVQLGIVKRNGKAFCRSELARFLRNPFYAGTMRLTNTGERFHGSHQPLISQALFERVQAVLAARRRIGRRAKHTFAYSRLIRCRCGRHLVGERIKQRYTYYRCHECRGVCIREERIDAWVSASLPNADDAGASEQVRKRVFEMTYGSNQLSFNGLPQSQHQAKFESP